MKPRTLALLIIIIFIISNCSSSKKIIEEKEISLSSNYFQTDKANLFYKLPVGWSEIKDNFQQLFELWLVSSEGNSSITFVPINLENNFTETSDFELLQFLVQTENKIKKASLQDFSILSEIKKFENNEIKFISMNYLDDNIIKRSVIFGKDKLFFECSAHFKNGYKPDENEIENLFKIQQLVLLSLKLK